LTQGGQNNSDKIRFIIYHANPFPPDAAQSAAEGCFGVIALKSLFLLCSAC
jgi:hypothetical protein